MNEKYKFLVVENDTLTSLGFEFLLKDHGAVTLAYSFLEANEYLKKEFFHIVFIDLDLEEELLGLELILPFSKCGSYSVVVTAREDDCHIERAYMNGCRDYLCKPFKKTDLEYLLKKFKYSRKKDLYREMFTTQFITQEQVLLDQLEKISEMIVNNTPIYIKGATGTGKTLLAKLLKEILFSKKDPFIHLNCSEISHDLIASELFGHEKGSFTGAIKLKKGLLELADGGVLFLDEIATMPMTLQQKLLKAIEEKTFYRIGGEKLIFSNFRIMSATCESLELMIAEKTFREDLYFRISGHVLQLPSLKDRREDISLLMKHFSKKNKRRVFISLEVYIAFQNYAWPGNIRELKKQMDILLAKDNGIVALEDLPDYIKENTQHYFKNKNHLLDLENAKELAIHQQIDVVKELGLKKFLEQMEESMIEIFYKKNERKVRETLKELKISNNVFCKIMDRVKH